MTKRSLSLAVTPLLFAWVAGCSDGEPTAHEGPPSLIESTTPAGFPKGTSGDQAPADNALTEARALLGKRLFYDPQLSRTNDVSCNTCHLQASAFADPKPVSIGVDGRTGTRKRPFDRERCLGQDLLLGWSSPQLGRASRAADRKPTRNGFDDRGRHSALGCRSELCRRLSEGLWRSAQRRLVAESAGQLRAQLGQWQ